LLVASFGSSLAEDTKRPVIDRSCKYQDVSNWICPGE
jgi:hypothetical protein